VAAGPSNDYDESVLAHELFHVILDNKGFSLGSADSSYEIPGIGRSIAAKRYSLYVKIGKTGIRIIDPKAHGVGFLYPPKNSLGDWDADVPQTTTS